MYHAKIATLSLWFCCDCQISFGLWPLIQIFKKKIDYKTTKGTASERQSFKNETSKGLKVVWVLHLKHLKHVQCLQNKFPPSQPTQDNV